MGGRWGGAMLAFLCVLTGCAAAQQQQQQQQLPAVFSTTTDQVVQFIAQAVRTELRPVVTKLESRIASLDSRLVLLDSRVDRLFEDRQSTQQNELSARLDRQQSQLDQLVTSLDEFGGNIISQKLQLENITGKVTSHKTNLDGITTQVETLSDRLSNQESQVNELVAALDRQEAQLAILNDTSSSELSRLDVVVNGTAGQKAPTNEQASGMDQMEAQLPLQDCSELPANSTSGVYLLALDRSQPPVSAFCDMDTEGGGWTVFQRRNDTGPHQNFFRKWEDYKAGFGDLTGEFWWGLENLHQLTSTRGRQFQLRVDLEAFDGDTSHALYQGFQVSPEEEGYTLQASDYTGTAGDGLRRSVGWKFSTQDRDRDGSSRYNCADRYKGAWWYDNCSWSSLNGRYLDGGPRDLTGIWWGTWKGRSLKQVQMGIRPV